MAGLFLGQAMLIGYHASHEQFSPSQLLEYVQAAEGAGFQAVMTSDHLAPWSARQGNSGNNWAWLGAVMAKTNSPVREPRHTGKLALSSGGAGSPDRNSVRNVPGSLAVDRHGQWRSVE